MTVKSTAEDFSQRLTQLEAENARLKEANSQLIQKNSSLRALIENSDDTVRKSALKYRTLFENNGTPTFIVNKYTTLALGNVYLLHISIGCKRRNYGARNATNAKR